MCNNYRMLTDTEIAAAFREYQALKEALPGLHAQLTKAKEGLNRASAMLQQEQLKAHREPTPGLSYHEQTVTYLGPEELALLLLDIREKEERFKELEKQLGI